MGRLSEKIPQNAIRMLGVYSMAMIFIADDLDGVQNGRMDPFTLRKVLLWVELAEGRY
jgi:hypothetical protein